MKYLHYKTYLSMIERCEGLELFRNFFAENENNKTIDLLDDGDNSCASFVSNILYINELIKSPHSTVDSTEKDLLDYGWVKFNEINDIKKGDLIIWAKDENHNNRHIGICLDNNKCVQNDSKLKKTKVENINFRKIENLFKYIKKTE